MARNLIRVDLELDNIIVHDEGDGWGDAEPYLWTVFFKVDGDTVSVTDSLTLSGPPTIETTPGSHGNLNTSDAEEGDNITIPSAIGEWSTILKPIPGPPSLSSLFEDFGGVIGVVAILMEEDNVSDDGAEAGHQALNQGVRDALQEIINTRSISNQDVTEDEIKGFTDAIESKIRDAIKNQQNFFENIWSWLNADDTIGTKVFLFKHDDLDPSTALNFSHRWQNEGDWEIFGHLSSSVLCPADTLSDFFSALQDGGAERASERRELPDPSGVSIEERIFRIDRARPRRPFVDLDPLRKFRDGPYRELPGLARWFELLERHSPRLIYLLARDERLRDSAREILEWAPRMVEEPEAALSERHLDHARRLLTGLSRQGSRQARLDAGRALDVLEHLRGKTMRQGLELLNRAEPARHPKRIRDLRPPVRPR